MNRTFDRTSADTLHPAAVWQPEPRLAHPESLLPPGNPSTRPSPFWVTTFLLLSLLACVLGALFVPSGLGLWAGYRELEAYSHEAAIQHFQRGLGFIAENYPDLAYTEFEIAAKYDNGYEPAQQKLSEMRAQFGNGSASPKTQEERIGAALYDEAKDMVARQQWSDAILRLEQLRALNPNASSSEATELLYQAYVGGGKDAVAIGQVQLARERFDAALSIRNTDAQIIQQRDLAVLYLEGQMAAGINWQTAIQKFAALYEKDPNYDNIKTRLVEAYTKYGDLAMKQNSPCLAAREYDSATGVVKDPALEAKRAQAMQACKQAITSPPTPTPSATESYTWKISADNAKPCTGTGDVSGTVVDTLGRPVVGAGIGYYADGIPLTSTRTDASGKYQLSWGKDAGLFHVVVLGADGKTLVGLAVDVQYPGGINNGCHWVIDWQKVQ